ncbi:hypothetical protein ABZ023_23185 [Streptomyces sp. NPDC006367]|uniref:hypothetical protein n=1 Tax=unclassified Streptomyces TaxID=2593676 RepID=UPI0033AEB1A2
MPEQRQGDTRPASTAGAGARSGTEVPTAPVDAVEAEIPTQVSRSSAADAAGTEVLRPRGGTDRTDLFAPRPRKDRIAGDGTAPRRAARDGAPGPADAPGGDADPTAVLPTAPAAFASRGDADPTAVLPTAAPAAPGTGPGRTAPGLADAPGGDADPTAVLPTVPAAREDADRTEVLPPTAPEALRKDPARILPEPGPATAVLRDPWQGTPGALDAGPDGPRPAGGSAHTHDPHEVTVQLDAVQIGDGVIRRAGAGPVKPAASDSSDGPVFVDASGRRSRRFRRIGIAVGGVCAIYAVVIVGTLLSGNSDAPWLPVPGQEQGKPAGQVETTPRPTQSTQPSATGGAVPSTSPSAGAGLTADPGAGVPVPGTSDTAEQPGASTRPRSSATATAPDPGGAGDGDATAPDPSVTIPQPPAGTPDPSTPPDSGEATTGPTTPSDDGTVTTGPGDGAPS